MSTTPSSKEIKYITECLHTSLLALAYPEHNGKWLLTQEINEFDRCMEVIRDEDEVNEMVYPILDKLEKVFREARRIRDGKDPDQSELFEEDDKP